MDMNQNQDPNFERRLILAFALSVLLFVLVMPLLTKKSTPAATPASKPAAAATQAPAAVAAPTPAEKASSPSAATPSAAKTAPPAKLPPAPVVTAAAESQTVINTPVFHVVFSNRGADVRTWVLTQYKDDRGQPLEFVDSGFSKQFGYPLSFWSKDSGVRDQLNAALYQVQQATAPNGDQTLTFTWSNGTLQATKKITFNSTYVADVQTSVTRDGQPLEVAIAWPGAFGDRAVPGDFKTEQYFQQSGTGVDTVKVSKVNNGETHQGQYDFAGIDDQYFAMAFLPQNGAPLTITTFNNSYQPRLTDATGNTITNEKVATVGLAVSTGSRNDTRLFVGPKKVQLLASVDPALRQLVNFGWFSFVAYPLFLWMNWTYVHWIHNYGWAILFLTFVITMAFFPLKMKAQKSMAKMMAIQPQVNALNAKMKKYGMRDPRRQEVQSEMMKLYSEHGVNPLGGCLPMLITLPLIYAFYDVLEYAIELRHAPWIGYIHDLSARDPYFILPLVVVVTQFLTIQLTPMTPGQDPRQAKMMKWMMPIFMGWFFFYLPAGVNLYYLGYNIVSTGQQWVANKTYNDAAVAAVAAKNAGKTAAGKSAARKKVIEGKIVSGKQ